MSLNKKKEITDRIWSHSKTSGANKLMLLAMTELADGDGFCWPSYETLGNMVGLTGTPDSIKRCALNNLAPLIERNEVIVWKQQGKKGGRGFTNIYLIAVGLTDEQIKEIVKRRFELQDNEVDSVLTKEGEEYTRLCTDRRVSSEALERTRDTKKGDTSIQHSQPMGDKSITDNSIKGDTSIQDDPAKSQKGDRLDTRTESSSLESYPNKESLQDSSPNGEGEKAPPPKKRKAKEPAEIPEGVKVYRSLAHLYPDKALWSEIDQTVGAEQVSLTLWHDVIYGYIGSGYHKRNVKTMLGYFRRREIPTTEKNGANYGTYQNTNRKGIKALEETGESLRQNRTTDTSTREYVYPDGHREPIPPVPRVPRRGLL